MTAKKCAVKLNGALKSKKRARPRPKAASAAQTAGGNGSERRTMPRRPGNPVEVRVADTYDPAEPLTAWVVDRSPEGMCLVSSSPVTAGTVVRVSPASQLGSAGASVDLEVRHCRREESIWILGCRSTAPLTWSQLRLFS
jgi:hypothetical protein